MDYFSPSENMKKLEFVLDEYLQWFLQVTSFIFYPDQDAKIPAAPDLFIKWAEHQKQENLIASEMLARVTRIYQDLVSESSKLLNQVINNGKRPDQAEYQSMAAFFDEFIKALRRIEQDGLMEGYGLDILTGLRTEKLVIRDMNREMDRLRRHGRNFCIALVKIDNFDITKVARGNAEESTIRNVAQMIKKSLRSFDDAYRLENGMFILILKQTDLFGGMKALERLKDLLEEKRLQADPAKASNITLSCCVAQPIKFDEPSVLVKDLKKFLDEHKNEEGVLLKFYELTPVQKFLKEGG